MSHPSTVSLSALASPCCQQGKMLNIEKQCLFVLQLLALALAVSGLRTSLSCLKSDYRRISLYSTGWIPGCNIETKSKVLGLEADCSGKSVRSFNFSSLLKEEHSFPLVAAPTMTMTEIPGPPAYPLIGNMLDVDAKNPLLSLCNLIRKYGEICKFWLGGEKRVVIGCSQALMKEICNEQRFRKISAAALKQAREGVHDGLGTANGPEEENWGIAHRILAPKLTSRQAIRNMFDGMHDIASQLVMKWARHGSDHVIEVNEDFTRLTFDTIALCTMNHRFNSFYYCESMHPFLQAMTGFLKTSGDRARRGWFTQIFYFFENRRFCSNIDLLRKTSLDIIQARKDNSTDEKDLLNSMLNEADSKTGKNMSASSVVDNIISFLIAGHDTTSGLLSFTLCYLLQNQTSYDAARKEVDDVLGADIITVHHLADLPFLKAVIRESLRLTPTVPSIIVTPLEDTTLGNKYHVKSGTPIIALPSMVHRDKIVYGDDAEEFQPTRMLDEAFRERNKRFPSCWKPFGNGIRSCIGQEFALQNALLVLALLLQRFDFSMEDTNYKLRIKQTLTIKPDGFRVRAKLREKKTAMRQ